MSVIDLFCISLAYTCESESKIQNVTIYKSNAKENVYHVQLTGPDIHAWYRSNFLMAHNIKISNICRKMMFGHLVLHDEKERMFRQWWHWLKLWLVWVHRQTLPDLAQTWSDTFFLRNDSMLQECGVECNPIQRQRLFSSRAMHLLYATDRTG